MAPGGAATTSERLCLKAGYLSRDRPEDFLDVEPDATGRTHQPAVYPFAAFLADRFGCTHVVDVGCGQAGKLARLHPRFEIVGVDHGENLAACRRHGFGTWVDWDLERDGSIPIPEDVLPGSAIVCADVIEHLLNPKPLLVNLRRWLDVAPICVLSTPERDLARGALDSGPPLNPAHVREWNLEELQALMRAAGLRVAFAGLTYNNDVDLRKNTSIVVLEGRRSAACEELATRTPKDFQVTAIMSAHDEADVIVASIRTLVDQGIGVYVVDNWSTDGTFEMVQRFQGRGLVGVERYPADGPSPHFRWAGYLRRLEQLAQSLPGDWFIHHDADEVRRPPWPGMSLRDALYAVGRAGFNCVDHTVVEFPPVDDGFVPGSNFEAYFRHSAFGRNPGHFLEMKAWERRGEVVSLTESGGHEAAFPGRRVFPYKFLLKHYPIRSQAHGERKVFRQRQVRNPPDERGRHWNTHYDHLRPGHCFLKDATELSPFDETAFNRAFLVERLSGVGIPQRAG